MSLRSLLTVLAWTLCSVVWAAEPPINPLVPGRFGLALDASNGPARVQASEAYSKCPITVECWARLRSAGEFNIVAANQPKESGTHWELYSYAGSGVLSAFLPGYEPSEIQSKTVITDDKWHYLAMTFDGQKVGLFADGKKVHEQEVKRDEKRRPVSGELCIGAAQQKGAEMSCNGLVDEVRLSSVIRQIDQVPDAPFAADEQTVGLWHFDSVDGGQVADASRTGAGARIDLVVGRSLDDIDRESFHAGPAPADSAAETVVVEPGPTEIPAGPAVVSLDGKWEMAEGGEEGARLSDAVWRDAIPADVPGSVHTALKRAGKIPEPTTGLNDDIARKQSFKTWWFRKSFDRPAGTGAKLSFGGVAVRCTVWLNGKKLGSHEGMFGGPEFDIANLLADHNTLVVRIDPAPYVPSDGKPNAFFTGMNVGWTKTVVFNNCYGWHYCNMPAVGIWQSVKLLAAPAVRLEAPFVATHDAAAGTVDVLARLKSPDKALEGTLIGSIAPENFAGAPVHFQYSVKSGSPDRQVHLRLTIPEAHLWWPNDLGAPDLYRLKLAFVPSTGGQADAHDVVFGIRSIQMAPWGGVPRAKLYNWTFVINGRPVFVKGANWCTMDAAMDFSRERYDRFLTLAHQQHLQILRAWGSGMPETDAFYDLCDRKGIMVLQEWPTAWNSQETQPYEMLEETVRLNTLRLRNHASLVMYGGGNESDRPFGPAIDMMGRYAIELDGTRPFHRGEPWGGSMHNYDCWWGKAPLDHNLNMVADFFGEFGIAALPVYESVQRYLPDNEKNVWPPPEKGSFAHHTPVFNTKEDLARLYQYSGYFFEPKNMRDFVLGSQLAQAVAVRHTLERARTRWPHCTGAIYYKMNDNYPAASWSCADWYGAPKLSFYINSHSFAPLHACVLFSTVNSVGQDLSLPVWLLDDADALAGSDWKVVVRAYGSDLKQIHRAEFGGQSSIERVRQVGLFELSAKQTQTSPLLTVVEVWRDGRLADRTFYWTNYEAAKGCLLAMPKTQVEMARGEGMVKLTNSGKLPAVGVSITRPGHADSFLAEDDCLWLDPGETRELSVNSTEGLSLDGWNVAGRGQ